MSLPLDLLIAALALLLAGRCLAARDERSAIVTFIAFGLLLTLAWLRLASVDVALTEIAIGSGATGFLLLGAEAHIRRAKAGGPQTDGPQAGLASPLPAALLCTLVAAGIAAVILLAPNPAPTLAPAAAAHLDATGLGNPVTAVLLAYRSFDTLLEKIVVLLALLGVWSVGPAKAWGGLGRIALPSPPPALVFLARTLPPIGLMIGIYMVWEGADEPGGTFQGGTILAAMWVLTMLTGLSRAPATNARRLRLLLAGGPALFLLVGFAGIPLAGAFLAYPEAWAKALIIGIEAALTVSIALALGLLIVGPAEETVER